MDLKSLFNTTKTENGDDTFIKVSLEDHLLNILFQTEYYQKHLSEVHIGTSDREKLFARFIRDPRYGLGRRDLGRVLMHLTKCTPEEMVSSGRFDDILFSPDNIVSHVASCYLCDEIKKGNELAKKWAPRYSSKNKALAIMLAERWGMNKQQYSHFIKANTVEQKLSRHKTEEIDFAHVPSLAMLKYYNRFFRGKDTGTRFAEYLQAVKEGKTSLKISTTTVYDIYRNRTKIDPDLFFDKIEKIAINCIPIVDTSGSMYGGNNDSIGKALSIGHYLAKCSTYLPNHVITFSSLPNLLELGKENDYYEKCDWMKDRLMHHQHIGSGLSPYNREIASMVTDLCDNTNFGAVMKLLEGLTDMPEYLCVLSDMEFDSGSSLTKEQTMQLWKKKGYTTKIIWWNLNSRHMLAPEMDSSGNIFLSGYSPMLLKFLECGFDAHALLNKLLEEYAKVI